MKKLENITKVFSVMKELGVSWEELASYNQENPFTLKLPLEILYEGGYRSFFVETGKIPVAIIVGNIGFAFEDAPERMNWFAAKEYCENYVSGKKRWTLPNHEANHLETLYKNKAAINEVLKAFGKESLKEDWYWSTNKNASYSWIIDISDGYVTSNSTYYKFYVRPILIF